MVLYVCILKGCKDHVKYLYIGVPYIKLVGVYISLLLTPLGSAIAGDCDDR